MAIRFTIRQLLVLTVWIAISSAAWSLSLSYDYGWFGAPVFVRCVTLGLTFAAVGAIFDRVWLGLAIGLPASLVFGQFHPV